MHQHCVVWIDHEKARMVFLDGEADHFVTVGASNATGHVHHKAGTVGAGKMGLEREFASAVEAKLRDCREFLVVGPGTAKTELMQFLLDASPNLIKKSVGVETVDHLTDNQLADYARSRFRSIDRMRHSNDEVLAGLSAHRPSDAPQG